jgi:transposase
MNDETATLQPEKLLFLTQKQAEMIELLTQELGRAKEQIEWLKRQLFGRKSERMEFDPNQLLLDPILMEAIENSSPAEAEPEIESQVAAHVRKSAPHGRGVLPTHLEREVIEIDIPADQKILPDGRMRPCIGFEESEKLACTPQRFFVKVMRRLKYGSPVGAEEFGVVEAPAPDSLVPRCLADESLLAHVAVSKFGDHLPAYRLEGIFKRSDINISRQTLCGWMQELGIALTPLIAEFKKQLFATGMVHNDDTPVNLLEENQKKPRGKKIRKARLWASCSTSRDGPLTVFDFTVSRGADGPKEFFKGYTGKMTCDAYSGYGPLAESGEGEPAIVLYGCWVHVRRYFFNAFKGGDPKLGAEFTSIIKILFEIEESIKEKTDEERLAVRRSRSRPVLDAIKARIEELLPVTPPKSALGKALNYATNYWDRLIRFVDDPQAGIDNNPAENAIRPIALGRKNWLFIGNQRSGHAAANIMSVICTCKRAGVEPYAYLLDIIRRLPSMKTTELAQLLPTEWKRAHEAPTEPTPAQL